MQDPDTTGTVIIGSDLDPEPKGYNYKCYVANLGFSNLKIKLCLKERTGNADFKISTEESFSPIHNFLQR